MKRLLTLFVLLQFFILANSQDSIDLGNCIVFSIQNFATQQNLNNSQNIVEMQKKIVKTAFLPYIKFDAQATYQSEVLEINLPIPGLEIPQMPYAQYKGYVEINQLIFDGGSTKYNNQLLDMSLKISNSQTIIQNNEIENNTAKIFFYLLILKKQIEISNQQLLILNDQLKFIESGIKNKTLTPVNRDILKMEILKIEQNIFESQNLYIASINILNLYTNQKFSENTNFYLSQKDTLFVNDSSDNPKIEILNYQSKKNDILNKQLKSTRLPQIYAFTQAGIGRPGLNFLNDEFSPYFIAGIKMSWRIYDWGTVSNSIKINQIKNLSLDIEKNNLQLLENAKIQTINGKIVSNNKLLQNDLQMIDLQQKIVETYKSQFENGIISLNDYLIQVNKLSQTKMMYEFHKIQLYQLKFELSNIY